MTTIIDIPIQAHASLVSVRNKVWFVAQALGLNPIESSRLASASSQLSRELLEAGIPTSLRLELMNQHHTQQLVASFHAPEDTATSLRIPLRYAGLVDEIHPHVDQILFIKHLNRHDFDENSCIKIREDMRLNVMPTRAELEMLATHDGLTHVLNRRSIEDKFTYELHRALRYKLSFSMMMLDIDHFKLVNDHYGHRGGDTCLTTLSAKLRELCREQDFVGRYGGEEFLVLLTHTRCSDAAIVAERLRSKVEAMSIRHDQQTIRCTISIGLACIDSNTEESQATNLLEHADQALYTAKESGRNQVCIYQNA